MKRIELFKAAAIKAAEAMELFPDLMAYVFTYPDRVSVCFDYKGRTRPISLYYDGQEPEHEERLHNLVAEAAALVEGVLQKRLKDVEEERDALAAKLEVMESQQEGGSHEA